MCRPPLVKSFATTVMWSSGTGFAGPGGYMISLYVLARLPTQGRLIFGEVIAACYLLTFFFVLEPPWIDRVRTSTRRNRRPRSPQASPEAEAAPVSPSYSPQASPEAEAAPVSPSYSPQASPKAEAAPVSPSYSPQASP